MEDCEALGWGGREHRAGRWLLPSCCMKTRATFSGRILRVWMKRERSPPAQNSMMR